MFLCSTISAGAFAFLFLAGDVVPDDGFFHYLSILIMFGGPIVFLAAVLYGMFDSEHIAKQMNSGTE